MTLSCVAPVLILASAAQSRAQVSPGAVGPPYAATLQQSRLEGTRLVRSVDRSAYPARGAVTPDHRLGSTTAGLAPRAYPPTEGSPVPTPPLPACGVISDCSFEGTGVGWFGTDLTTPLLVLGVYAAGLNQGYGFFSLTPTDGALCLATGFDGDGPGDITAFQDIVLTPKSEQLVFDFRTGWDMLNFTASSTLPREFFVEIQPSGGGPVLQSTLVFSALPLTVLLDSGNITTAVPVSAFAGQAVRIVFRWNVPEAFTGPAICQVDRVGVIENDCLILSNCSFESGAFPNWLALDMPIPYFGMSIQPAGVSTGFGLFTTAPTDGALSFFTGFDGGGPADSKLVQDLVLPADVFSVDFDYRAGWDMFNFGGSTLPREFFMEVEPFGGGPVLQSTRLLSAPPGTVRLDTGSRKGLVDVSSFAGAAVRLVFRWHIPEYFTGPGQFQLDHVQLTRESCASISNCSFETGGFGGWNVADMVIPFIAMHVGAAGEINGYGAFTSAPTDGRFALLNGFDGAGPDVINVFQDLKLPLWSDLLRFDFRAGWDMLNFGGSTRPRTFSVEVQPSGGGPALAQDIALVAPPQTLIPDTGPISRTLPVGAFAGQDVRLVFHWDIPEYLTGPAFFQLDHVTLGSNPLDAGPGGQRVQALSLSAAPNPSREVATFRFALPTVSDVQLEVVDVRGALVWSEHRRALPVGEHQIAWNGVRSTGGRAPAGVYYARVQTPGATRTRMFVRVR